MNRRMKKEWNNNAFTQGKKRKGKVCSRRLVSFLLVSTTIWLETRRVPSWLCLVSVVNSFLKRCENKRYSGQANQSEGVSIVRRSRLVCLFHRTGRLPRLHIPRVIWYDRAGERLLASAYPNTDPSTFHAWMRLKKELANGSARRHVFLRSGVPRVARRFL